MVELVEQTGASWNQIVAWLRRLVEFERSLRNLHTVRPNSRMSAR